MTEQRGDESFDTLRDFVSTAQGVIATGQDLDESNTKAKIVTPLIRVLGWDIYDNNEVLLEYSGDANFEDRVDYALLNGEGVYAVIEAKQIGRNIDEHHTQLRRYMRLFNSKWGLLTNGERYIIYKSSGQSEEDFVDSIPLSDLPQNPHLQDFTRRSAYAESVSAEGTNLNSSQSSLQSREEAVSLIDDAIQGEWPPDTLYSQLADSIAPSIRGHKRENIRL